MTGAAASAWFAASTTVVDQLPDAWLMALALVAGSLVALAYGGLPTPARWKRAGSRDALVSASGGMLAFAVAPLLVLACRRTDAPSGSETLLFTTAAWGVLVVLVALVTWRKPSLTQLAASLLGLLGAAAVLANWERPSSFSPFAKFPLLEAGMLAAGVLFAIGSAMLVTSARRHGHRAVLSLGWSAAAVLVLLYALVRGDLPSAGTLGTLGVPLLLAGLSLGAFAAAWVASAVRIGLPEASSALFLPPVLLTAVSTTEGVARAAFGASPIQWAGASGGIALTLVGVVALLSLRRETDGADLPWARSAAWVALLAALAGVGALALPAFSVELSGTIAERDAYNVAWTMLGYEAGRGWLALVVALFALAGALDSARLAWARSRRLGVAAGVLLASATWLLLADTPLRTWTRWLRADVLQDLGTEYAHIAFVSLTQPAGLAALGLACLSAGILAGGALKRASRGGSRPEGTAV